MMRSAHMVRCAVVAWMALGCRDAQAQTAAVAASSDDKPALLRNITVRRLGYPDGVSIDGATAAGSVLFPLPRGVRLLDGRLNLMLDVTRSVSTGSNVQVFINGARRLMLPRTPGDTTLIAVSIPLREDDLSRNFLELQVRSFIAIGRDRCIDERLGSAYVTILPASNLGYAFDPRTVRGSEALWALLPDTVRVLLPARRLTASEFLLAYDFARELRGDGRSVQFARDSGLFAIDSTAPMNSLVAWRRLVSRRSQVLPDDPTLEQLGITDLARQYSHRGVWQLPVDVRRFPPDRVPSAIDLQVTSAGNADGHGVQYHVFMNGMLLRSFAVVADGNVQTLHVDLPQYLLNTYNEVRVEVQRQRTAAEDCLQAETMFPAQISGASVVRTTAATRVPHLFTGAALRLANHFPLYLPRAVFDSGENYLDAVVSLSRGLWGDRTPRIELYDRVEQLHPNAGFVIVGDERVLSLEGPVHRSAGSLVLAGAATGEVHLVRKSADAFVAEVARWDGQVGIAVSLPRGGGPVSDVPEAYGNADALVRFPSESQLRVSSDGLSAEDLYGEFGWLRPWLWSPGAAGGAALILVALALAVWLRGRRSRERGTDRAPS